MTGTRDRALALFLSEDLLPTARLKSELAAEINSLAQTRDKLVKVRATLQNKLHALVVARGEKSRQSAFASARGLQAILARAWSVTTRVEVEVIVAQLHSLNESLKRLDAQLKESGAQLAGFSNLVTSTGVGARAAAILLSVIGDAADFESEEKLASYFGVVPRVANSNESVRVPISVRGKMTSDTPKRCVNSSQAVAGTKSLRLQLRSSSVSGWPESFGEMRGWVKKGRASLHRSIVSLKCSPKSSRWRLTPD